MTEARCSTPPGTTAAPARQGADDIGNSIDLPGPRNSPSCPAGAFPALPPSAERGNELVKHLSQAQTPAHSSEPPSFRKSPLKVTEAPPAGRDGKRGCSSPSCRLQGSRWPSRGGDRPGGVLLEWSHQKQGHKGVGGGPCAKRPCPRGAVPKNVLLWEGPAAAPYLLLVSEEILGHKLVLPLRIQSLLEVEKIPNVCGNDDKKAKKQRHNPGTGTLLHERAGECFSHPQKRISPI
ncbi:hypothetical protein Anapl_17530 [Anas platyrhynchos]|uniref:Uncharacterized protein n=1 Tax=Anas platyrhynchos TaxID=8839 RepID=R0KAB3_ANAPL|nr:hypothetical protein Anapl_17530 [Anas platyrhynchos]